MTDTTKAQAIQSLTNADIGKWITYKPELEKERGRIKSFDNERKVAWVVYKASGNWDLDHWKNYTAQCTNYRDLYL
jgi:hypothetical protein